MGQYSTIVGSTTFVMLLIGKEVIKYFGWEAGALATPVMMTVLAVPFFGWEPCFDINILHVSGALFLKGLMQHVHDREDVYIFIFHVALKKSFSKEYRGLWGLSVKTRACKQEGSPWYGWCCDMHGCSYRGWIGIHPASVRKGKVYRS